MKKSRLGKKGGFDMEDVFALLLWVMIVILFLIILDMGGCTKGFSKITISSQRENTMDATRILLNYLNNEVDYNNRKVRMGDLISEFYITLDIPEKSSERDTIQKIITEKTKEILGKKECWTIIVIANPRIRIESDKCKEMSKDPLVERVSRVKVTTKLPNNIENLVVEYQEYVFVGLPTP